MTLHRYTALGRPLTLRHRTGDALDTRWGTAIPKLAPKAHVNLARYVDHMNDQGQEGSCSAESGSYCRQILAAMAGDHTRLSPAFLYQAERILQGDLNSDNGAQLSDTELALLRYGVCPEAEDPYSPKDYVVRFTPKLIADAKHYAIKAGYWTPTIDEITDALSHGIPVQLGIVVYESYENAPVSSHVTVGPCKGQPVHRIPMPQAYERALGGHAITICGFNRATREMWGPGSWGNWGWHSLSFDVVSRPDVFMDARAYTV